MSQITTSVSLEAFNESQIKFSYKPMNTGINFSMGKRNSPVEIENTSSQFLLGDMKPNEISLFSRINGRMVKEIKREGTQYQIVTLTVADNGGAVNTKYDGDSDIVWVNNTSTLATHQVEMIPPKRMNQKMIVFHNYTGGSSELNSGVRVNFGVTARCVEGIFHYHSSSGGTVAGSNITNTLTSAMTANNKYIILLKKRYITFIGMKNPLTDELFWIVEDSVGKKLN